MPPERPNVLWIFADQLRYHSLSSSGDPNLATPNIDRLAAEGVRCTAAFSHYPICTPFRAGLMTGLHASACGVPLHGDFLPPGSDTVAHRFRASGYRTSYVGKWHLAGARGANMVSEAGWAGEDFWVHPQLRGGFQDWFGFNISNNYYRTFYSSGERIEPKRLDGYQTDALTDLSLDYLDGYQGDAPWFHVIGYESPHPGHGGSPRVPLYPVPERYQRMFEADRLELRDNVPASKQAEARQQLCGYYSLIANLDDNVGRLLDWLEERGQSERTLVVFFSDHGEMGGSHGLRNKEMPYEESIRIPLLFRLPGTLPAGRDYRDPISGLDIYPTSTGLCGVEPASGIHGLNHAEALQGQSDQALRSSVLIQWLGTRFAFGDHPYRALRTPTHSYVVGRDPETCMLFDNEADPYQLRNLYRAESHGELRRRLHDELLRMIKNSGERVPDFVVRRSPGKGKMGEG